MERLGTLRPTLDAALRHRASTPQQLAELTGLRLDQTREHLAALEALGFVSVTNDVVTYRRPDSAVAGYAEGLVTTLAADAADALQRAQSALGLLPDLLQAWTAGASDANSLHVDMLHGPWAPADMWRLQFARRVPQLSRVCMPNTAALFAPQEEYQAAFWAERADAPIDVQLIMSVADATHPLARERIRGELDSGVRIRMHPAPPSFFWITDRDTVGIPAAWGEAWPTSVVGIQSAPLADMLGWIFDRIWAEAIEVDLKPSAADEHVWDPMLKLMSHGLTMDAASAALGIAPRTGRRRVADAMAHYNVSGHLALGVAWGRARAERVTPAAGG